MKNTSIILVVLFLSTGAGACDSVIREFKRDCAIQDQFTSLRERFKKQNINIDDLAEYRALRFIERPAWEEAKKKGKRVESIYEPAPLTWRIWDAGIRTIFNNDGALNKNILSKDLTINEASISSINHNLLSDGHKSVKDKATNAELYAGQYRSPDAQGVGFCSDAGPDYQAQINEAIKSAAQFQQRWETAVGYSLSSALVTQTGAAHTKFDRAFLPDLTFYQSQCNQFNKTRVDVFINYLESAQVMDRIKALSLFVKINLELYQQNKPAVAPIALAAFVQKWLIFTHPFADGNGRTSRAVQDLILTNFNMPFAPSGDLQDDVLISFDKYLELNYVKMEAMLSVLNDCASMVEGNQSQLNTLPQCRVLTGK